MKKKFLALVLTLISVAALCTALAGCGTEESSGGPAITAKEMSFSAVDLTLTFSAKGLTGKPTTEGDGNPRYIADVCLLNNGNSAYTTGKLYANLFTYGNLTATGMIIYEEYGPLPDELNTETFGRWEPMEFHSFKKIDDGATYTDGRNLDASALTSSTDLRLAAKEIWRVLVIFDEQPASDTLRYQSAPVYYRSASNGIDDYPVIGTNIHMCLNHEAGEPDVYERTSLATIYTYTTAIEKTFPSTAYILSAKNLRLYDLAEGTEILPENFTLEVDGEKITCKGFYKNTTYATDEQQEEIWEAVAAENGYTDTATAFLAPSYGTTSYTGRNNIVYDEESYIRNANTWLFNIKFDFGLAEQPDSYKLYYNFNGTETEITLSA